MANDSEVTRYQRHLTRNGCEVMHPAVPFVLEGPDLLVRNGIRASMVFFPRPNEARSLGLLAGRIAGALLAYPSHVAPIAVLPPDADADVLDRLNNRLSVATSTDELMKMAATDGRRPARGTEELRRVKQLHLRRYGRVASAQEHLKEYPVAGTASSSQFHLSLKLREMRKGDKAMFGVRAAQTSEGLLLTAVSPRVVRRAAAELTQSSFGLLYELDNAVPYPTSGTVDRGLVVDHRMSAGREDALWFALVHTTR